MSAILGARCPLGQAFCAAPVPDGRGENNESLMRKRRASTIPDSVSVLPIVAENPVSSDLYFPKNCCRGNSTSI
jgi:hypothetical protein